MTNYFRLVSVEVGNVAANVIVAEFSNEVVSMDFTAGIVITVSGTRATITKALRTNGQKKIQYTINLSVTSTDTVKLFYNALPAAARGMERSSRFGDYTTSDFGVVMLETFANITVTNNVVDTIGNAIRAALTAYWTFNETSGSRADSTGRSNTLTDVNSNVGAAAAKVGNGAQFTGTATKLLRRNHHADVAINPLNPFYLFTWAKLNLAQISGNGIVLYQKGLDSEGEIEYSIHYYDPAQKFIVSNYNGNEAQSSVTIADNTWYFVEFIYDPDLGDFGQFGIAINGGAFAMADLYEGGVSTFSHPLHVGNDDDDNFVGAGLIDEGGIINDRLPTSAERTYLYNGGTGRTLYP